MISFFVPEISKFSYYANLVTDDVIGCASTVVRLKIKNISTNNEAMRLKLGRDVVPYEIYQMVHILLLLWQHARFQSLAPSKWNITICDSTRQNTWSYLRCMPVPPSLGLLLNIFNSIFFPVKLQMGIFDLEEEGTGTKHVAIATSKCVSYCMVYFEGYNIKQVLKTRTHMQIDTAPWTENNPETTCRFHKHFCWSLDLRL